ncbi:MAG: hypothetical protein ACXVZ3_15970, partial [Gaiellaceae bacterium]
LLARRTRGAHDGHASPGRASGRRLRPRPWRDGVRAAGQFGLAAAWAALAALWVRRLEGPWWALAYAATCVALGFLGGSWWYVLLPVVLGPLAIGTSTGDAGAGWALALFLAAPIAAALVAAGVVLGRLARR